MLLQQPLLTSKAARSSAFREGAGECAYVAEGGDIEGVLHGVSVPEGCWRVSVKLEVLPLVACPDWVDRLVGVWERPRSDDTAAASACPEESVPVLGLGEPALPPPTAGEQAAAAAQAAGSVGGEAPGEHFDLFELD